MLDKDMCDRKKTTCETVQKQDFFFIFARKSAYEGTNFVEFLLYVYFTNVVADMKNIFRQVWSHAKEFG